MSIEKIDVMWDDNPIDVTSEVNFIWSIANKLRGPYKSDKYKDVIIPMTIIRRFECALEETKEDVLKKFKENPNYPSKAMYKISGFQFYNTSKYNLNELINDPDHLADNFKNYINGFSSNIQDIIKNLDFDKEINKMDKHNRLLNIVKAFSELDLNPKTIDNMKMGYIFEELIRKFSENAEAGDHYTGRDIIKLMVSLLLAEGCDDIFDEGKIITILDQAAGTGGMLSVAHNYIKRFNPSADIHLFSQEINPESYAMCLAEMLIRGQNAENIRLQDTMISDEFPDTKMRFCIMNPPFGQAWGGKDASEGVEQAVRDEALKGEESRWPAGLPKKSDMQLLFVQSALNKIDDNKGRIAIIENGSPLFTGDTSSGESQIRRWLLKNDYIESIIQLNDDMFYNTPITTYIWILSKNKDKKRKGKIQLIDASSFSKKLRKPLGKKRYEISAKDRVKITELYSNFEENEFCKIRNNIDFVYKEYAIMQPLQRNYSITQDRIKSLISNNYLKSIYDLPQLKKLENKEELTGKEQLKLNKIKEGKPLYDKIIKRLCDNISDEIYYNYSSFELKIHNIIKDIFIEPKQLKNTSKKIIEGLSIIDKNAEVQKDNKGNIKYDESTKTIELVPYEVDIQEYMEKEVLPFVPDAKAFFEENLRKKKPIIKTGAEIPFPRMFYKYQHPRMSDEIAKEITENKKSFKQLPAYLDTYNSNKNMKNTGIEWIGEIPSSWEILPNKYVMHKVKDICLNHTTEDILSLSKKGVIVRNFDDGGKMPATFDGYQRIHSGNLLMCLFDIDVTPRCVGIIKNEGLTSPAYSQFVLNEDVDVSYFYYYYLMLDEDKTLVHLSKNLRHSITEDQLGDMAVIKPPLKEQIKISNFLDEKINHIDDEIAKLENLIEVYNEYKKSLIFEYVTGKKEVPE